MLWEFTLKLFIMRERIKLEVTVSINYSKLLDKHRKQAIEQAKQAVLSTKIHSGFSFAKPISAKLIK